MFIPVRSQFFWSSRLLLAAITLLLSSAGTADFYSGAALAQPATKPNQLEVKPEIKTNITNISNQDVRRYAAAVLAIEPIRLKYYDLARQQVPGKMPQDLCLGNQKANIPNGLEDICNNYMQESTAIIESNHLTPGQFDAITKQAQTDKALRDRIQKHLRQQQKDKP